MLGRIVVGQDRQILGIELGIAVSLEEYRIQERHGGEGEIRCGLFFIWGRGFLICGSCQ